jgi:hypothetical protein
LYGLVASAAAAAVKSWPHLASLQMLFVGSLSLTMCFFPHSRYGCVDCSVAATPTTVTVLVLVLVALGGGGGQCRCC